MNNEQESQKEKTAMISMQIIIHAGDARNLIMEALDEIAEFKFDNAKEKLNEAENEIHQSHKYQTEVIQSEAAGDVFEYSILFTHAQDTLMTICTELNIAKKLCNIFEHMDKHYEELKANYEG